MLPEDGCCFSTATIGSHPISLPKTEAIDREPGAVAAYCADCRVTP
jgi:hypothetical protein